MNMHRIHVWIAQLTCIDCLNMKFTSFFFLSLFKRSFAHYCEQIKYIDCILLLIICVFYESEKEIGRVKCNKYGNSMLCSLNFLSNINMWRSRLLRINGQINLKVIFFYQERERKDLFEIQKSLNISVFFWSASSVLLSTNLPRIWLPCIATSLLLSILVWLQKLKLRYCFRLLLLQIYKYRHQKSFFSYFLFVFINSLFSFAMRCVYVFGLISQSSKTWADGDELIKWFMLCILPKKEEIKWRQILNAKWYQ